MIFYDVFLRFRDFFIRYIIIRYTFNILLPFYLPYSFVKKFKDNLNAESKERLAKRQEKLDTLIWWYEDLRCANVDDMLGQIDLFPFG